MSKEIKLKQIVENFMVGGVVNKPAFSNLDMFKTKISTEDVNSDIRLSSLMPEDHEEGHEIDEEQFLEDVRNFGSLGKHIYRENDIRAVAEKLSNIAKTARTHTLRETEEWFDKITINRNMKELNTLSGQFSKIANDAQGLQERMSALYEDMGHIIGRYYEVNEEPVKEALSMMVKDRSGKKKQLSYGQVIEVDRKRYKTEGVTKMQVLVMKDSGNKKKVMSKAEMEDGLKKGTIELIDLGTVWQPEGIKNESINEGDFRAWKKADRDWKKEQRKIEQIVKKFFSKHDIDVDDRDIFHKLGELQDDMGDVLTRWSDGL